MTVSDGPVGHDNDEQATSTAAAAAAAIVSGAATSTPSTSSTSTSSITDTAADTVVAAAATAPRPVPSPAHEPEAAASTTTTTTDSVSDNTTLTDSSNPPPHPHPTTTTTSAAVTAAATVPSIASAAAATTDTEPVQHPPLPSQENSDDQQQRQPDDQQHQVSQVNGSSRLPENNSDAVESESDMSNHRTGHSASVHHLNHHNHHHHSHSLSTSYPTSTSSGASPVYSAAATLSSTQYAASYPTVTSVTALTADPFRVSPVASTQMPLPSMRTIDAISQQGQSPAVSPLPHHSMSMGMSMPLVAVSASPQYYSGHSMALPSNYTLAQDLAQYPLPPHDPRLLNHRGPKKEIKRRTKTGCLTCRKRRIKCDETHPTCNNCRKSKRECLGYDPIFRQQTIGQSGNTIQPAPGSLPPSPQAPVATSAYPSPSLTQVPVSRVGSSFSSQPPILSSVYATTPASTIPSPTSSTIPTASISYHSSPTVKAESNSDFSAVKLDGTFEYSASNLDRSIRQLPTPASIDTRHLNSKPGHLPEIHYPRATKMKIREIIDLLGPPASPQQISHTEEAFHEITKVYHEMYAPGLSAFFETSWYYFTENGKMSFPQEIKLIEHMATFLKILEGVKANDHTQIAVSGALETRIVWELACTAYQTPERTNPMRINLPPDNDAIEARNRLQVVEALLCGDYLPTNLLSPPVSDNDHHRIRQFDFWYCLGEFVRKQENPYTPINMKSREDTLSRMRHLLDERENRDVLYSIAVVRELAPGFEPEYGNTIPQHLDESDPKNRLAVASKFILDESQVSGGTTNVVRRFSDIASRAFVNPGVNIARRV